MIIHKDDKITKLLEATIENMIRQSSLLGNQDKCLDRIKKETLEFIKDEKLELTNSQLNEFNKIFDK
jgi:hypothetical protein